MCFTIVLQTELCCEPSGVLWKPLCVLSPPLSRKEAQATTVGSRVGTKRAGKARMEVGKGPEQSSPSQAGCDRTHPAPGRAKDMGDPTQSLGLRGPPCLAPF